MAFHFRPGSHPRQVLKLLLEQGASSTAKDHRGRTPAHCLPLTVVGALGKNWEKAEDSWGNWEKAWRFVVFRGWANDHTLTILNWSRSESDCFILFQGSWLFQRSSKVAASPLFWPICLLQVQYVVPKADCKRQWSCHGADLQRFQQLELA